jgi:pimeloyl-ACP methyl ester carboxylesterase
LTYSIRKSYAFSSLIAASRPYRSGIMEIPENFNLRKHGKAPFTVAVIHGGPGAGGEMAPIARELASARGVLEPIQTQASLAGQLEEMKTVLYSCAELPVTLIGFSWGAWLSFIFAAHYPEYVKKLILVSSGPFKEHYAEKILETRLTRLSIDEKAEVCSVMEILNSPEHTDKNMAFQRFGTLFSKTDAYDPIAYETEDIDYSYDIYKGVWDEAWELRKSGELFELGKDITCPVVAIHGDFDPHPPDGVSKPLSVIIRDFRFILLKNCGHRPWIEREARDKFYRILKDELG